MGKETNCINWSEMMDKFSKFEGSIIDFCKNNNIKHYQLYHQRKKLEKTTTPTFHAIAVTKTEDVKNVNSPKQSIKIEIGNAKIFVPIDDNASLLSIVRELARSC